MMRKRYICVLILIFCLFLNITNVSAKTCAEIDITINKYNDIKKQLSELDCTKVDDTAIVNKCNNLNLQKTNILSEIYRINENEKQCSTQLSQTESILKENESECGIVLGDTLNKWVNAVMGAFYIIGPVLVILFGTLDFGKATISSEKDALKKASNKFFKRLGALILLFLSPILTKLIISLNTSGEYLEGDAYSCEYKNIWARKEIKIVNVEKPDQGDSSLIGEGNSSSGNSSTTSVSGDFLSWKQYAGSWANVNIRCGTMRQCGCLLTAVSIQIANSGTAKSKSFNPGTFANTIKAHGGLTSGGAFTWTGWSSIAPKFHYVGQRTISGTQAQKAKTLASYIEQGYYPVAEVKKGGCGQHWVAVISVQGSEITIADPGSSKTKLNGSTYPCFVSSSHAVALFEIK